MNCLSGICPRIRDILFYFSNYGPLAFNLANNELDKYGLYRNDDIFKLNHVVGVVKTAMHLKCGFLFFVAHLIFLALVSMDFCLSVQTLDIVLFF